MFGRHDLASLQKRLEAVNAQIAEHPLASETVRRAHAIVEARGNADEAELQARLTDEGLPSLEELGKIQLRNTSSWWALHREKRNLERKIRKLSGS